MKCHGITEEQAENPKFVFVCTSCKRKEAETEQPKPQSLKLRLTSQSPASNNQVRTNGVKSSGLDSIQIPIPQAYQPSMHPAQPWADGPSLSPRGQALGPPGIQRSEAAYGSPTKGANGSMSSPIRPRPSSPRSSPPPYDLQRIPSSPTKSTHTSHPPQNGGSSFGISNPFSSNPFGSSQPAPSYARSFSRPTSAAGGSPVKHSPPPRRVPPTAVCPPTSTSTALTPPFPLHLPTVLPSPQQNILRPPLFPQLCPLRLQHPCASHHRPPPRCQHRCFPTRFLRLPNTMA